MTERADAVAVSAVICTVDRPKLLRAAIAAVAAQDFDGVIETIVVFDNREPDLTLASDDPQRPVRVLANNRTPGLAGARNTGLLAATGTYVALCDDDDEWRPAKTRAQVEALDRRPDRHVAVTGMVIQYDGKQIERIWPHAELTLEDVTSSRAQDAHPSSILARRDAIITTIGLVDEALPASYGEDHDLLIRAARVAPIVVVRRPLIDVAWHRASHFSDPWQKLIDGTSYLVAKHPELRSNRRGYANMRGRQAFAHAALGDTTTARRVALDSLRHNPIDKRAAVALIVSTGLVPITAAQRLANALGRGI